LVHQLPALARSSELGSSLSLRQLRERSKGDRLKSLLSTVSESLFGGAIVLLSLLAYLWLKNQVIEMLVALLSAAFGLGSVVFWWLSKTPER